MFSKGIPLMVVCLMLYTCKEKSNACFHRRHSCSLSYTCPAWNGARMRREARIHVSPILSKLPEAYREPVEKRDALQIVLIIKHGFMRHIAKAVAWWRWERGLSLMVRE
jgi:hypothetical protein